jgi:hypothetical protein
VVIGNRADNDIDIGENFKRLDARHPHQEECMGSKMAWTDRFGCEYDALDKRSGVSDITGKAA